MVTERCGTCGGWLVARQGKVVCSECGREATK